MACALGTTAAERLDRPMGVARQDSVTLVTALAVLPVVAVAAGWLPARRAAVIDPGRAMRI